MMMKVPPCGGPVLFVTAEMVALQDQIPASVAEDLLL